MSNNASMMALERSADGLLEQKAHQGSLQNALDQRQQRLDQLTRQSFFQSRGLTAECQRKQREVEDLQRDRQRYQQDIECATMKLEMQKKMIRDTTLLQLVAHRKESEAVCGQFMGYPTRLCRTVGGLRVAVERERKLTEWVHQWSLHALGAWYPKVLWQLLLRRLKPWFDKVPLAAPQSLVCEGPTTIPGHRLLPVLPVIDQSIGALVESSVAEEEVGSAKGDTSEASRPVLPAASAETWTAQLERLDAAYKEHQEQHLSLQTQIHGMQQQRLELSQQQEYLVVHRSSMKEQFEQLRIAVGDTEAQRESFEAVLEVHRENGFFWLANKNYLAEFTARAAVEWNEQRTSLTNDAAALLPQQAEVEESVERHRARIDALEHFTTERRRSAAAVRVQAEKQRDATNGVLEAVVATEESSHRYRTLLGYDAQTQNRCGMMTDSEFPLPSGDSILGRLHATTSTLSALTQRREAAKANAERRFHEAVAAEVQKAVVFLSATEENERDSIDALSDLEMKALRQNYKFATALLQFEEDEASTRAELEQLEEVMWLRWMKVAASEYEAHSAMAMAINTPLAKSRPSKQLTGDTPGNLSSRKTTGGASGAATVVPSTSGGVRFADAAYLATPASTRKRPRKSGNFNVPSTPNTCKQRATEVVADEADDDDFCFGTIESRSPQDEMMKKTGLPPGLQTPRRPANDVACPFTPHAMPTPGDQEDSPATPMPPSKIRNLGRGDELNKIVASENDMETLSTMLDTSAQLLKVGTSSAQVTPGAPHVPRYAANPPAPLMQTPAPKLRYGGDTTFSSDASSNPISSGRRGPQKVDAAQPLPYLTPFPASGRRTVTQGHGVDESAAAALTASEDADSAVKTSRSAARLTFGDLSASAARPALPTHTTPSPSPAPRRPGASEGEPTPLAFLQHTQPPRPIVDTASKGPFVTPRFLPETHQVGGAPVTTAVIARPLQFSDDDSCSVEPVTVNANTMTSRFAAFTIPSGKQPVNGGRVLPTHPTATPKPTQGGSNRWTTQSATAPPRHSLSDAFAQPIQASSKTYGPDAAALPATPQLKNHHQHSTKPRITNGPALTASVVNPPSTPCGLNFAARLKKPMLTPQNVNLAAPQAKQGDTTMPPPPKGSQKLLIATGRDDSVDGSLFSDFS